MSRTARLLSLLLLVLGLAISAREAMADFQYATTVNPQGATTATLTSGSLANIEDAPDGVTATYTADAGGDIVRLVFVFSSTVSNPSVILYGLQATNTVTITEVMWDDLGGGYAQSTNPFITISAAVPGVATDYELRLPFNGFDTAPSGTGFTAGVNRKTFITFSLSANATLTLDAVSNPEPGTSALFALGAGAFLVARMRRRRAVRSGGSST